MQGLRAIASEINLAPPWPCSKANFLAAVMLALSAVVPRPPLDPLTLLVDFPGPAAGFPPGAAPAAGPAALGGLAALPVAGVDHIGAGAGVPAGGGAPPVVPLGAVGAPAPPPPQDSDEDGDESVSDMDDPADQAPLDPVLARTARIQALESELAAERLLAANTPHPIPANVMDIGQFAVPREHVQVPLSSFTFPLWLPLSSVMVGLARLSCFSIPYLFPPPFENLPPSILSRIWAIRRPHAGSALPGVSPVVFCCGLPSGFIPFPFSIDPPPWRFVYALSFLHSVPVLHTVVLLELSVLCAIPGFSLCDPNGSHTSAIESFLLHGPRSAEDPPLLQSRASFFAELMSLNRQGIINGIGPDQLQAWIALQAGAAFTPVHDDYLPLGLEYVGFSQPFAAAIRAASVRAQVRKTSGRSLKLSREIAKAQSTASPPGPLLAITVGPPPFQTLRQA
ncbi:hypothetical protein HDU67_008725 [Dinochytrium kinnereticum]|nr:hypothetical protein HDU67_008725 [Dinochytrium kinnereticum]